MQKRFWTALLLLTTTILGWSQEMWYQTPADEWMKALPVANGRVGIMVYGGTLTERLALNESSMWSGGVNPDQNRRYGREGLDSLRQYFFRGDLRQGNDIANRYLTGNESDFGSHVPLGDIVIKFKGNGPQRLNNYRRSLSLDEAIARVDYQLNDVKYEREYFGSHPQGVVVARYTASKRGALSCEIDASLLRPEAKTVSVDNRLEISGIASQPGRTSRGVRFLAILEVKNVGGTVASENGKLVVRDADELVLVADLRTDYRNPEYEKVCRQSVAAAIARPYEQMKREHVEDYSPLYHRVNVQLGDADANKIPTDHRWLAIKQGADDPALQAMFLQFGRYLTIIQSRKDSPLPIALQGFFNDNLACNMGWNNDYHLDINTEQNYWLANVGNLHECNYPLFRYIGDMARAGAATAQSYYDCRGWMAHCTANIWGFTAPAGYIGWGLHVTGGCWMATHLWMHYEYTHDVDYLRTVGYPILKGSALFLLDYMCEDPKTGYLVTGPSISPENSFGLNGQNYQASMMPTVDLVLAREILSGTLQSAEILGVDATLADSLRHALAKLPPLRVNKYGGVREWMEDYDDTNVNHRHTSHLLALFPYGQISTQHTPELAEAAYNTMQRRLNAEGWEDVEWSRANAICNYARLRRAEEAYQSVNQLIGSLSRENLFTVSPKGIAGAPWDIFAIDGNTAGAAGVAEMMVQGHAGYVEFLPAIPKAWSDGSFNGLCVRGGAEASAQWTKGKVNRAELKATAEGDFAVLLPEGTRAKVAGQRLTPDVQGIVRAHLKPGESIKIAK